MSEFPTSPPVMTSPTSSKGGSNSVTSPVSARSGKTEKSVAFDTRSQLSVVQSVGPKNRVTDSRLP